MPVGSRLAPPYMRATRRSGANGPSAVFFPQPIPAPRADAAIGCLPVGENDRLIGMVTDHDLVWRGFADGADPRPVLR